MSLCPLLTIETVRVYIEQDLRLLPDFANQKSLLMNKLTIFAMTKKGRAVVEAIHSEYPEIISAVISSRDNNMAEDCYDDIRNFCNMYSIPFYERKQSVSVSTEYSLAISWRWMIKTESSRLIVFHDSLLPRLRGFNPLVTALINGDNKIGVTAIFGTDEYDKGDIIAQIETPITYPITISKAIDIILDNYVALALQIADTIKKGADLVGVPQVEEFASYSLWRDEEDYFIDWKESASQIKRTIDALGFPYKGAASLLDGKLVRLIQATVMEDVKIENRAPGKVIFVQNSSPVVVCGQGLLRIDELRDDQGVNLLPLPRFRIRFK